jgi:predicted deacetylase
MKIILEFDDLHPDENVDCLDVIKLLRKNINASHKGPVLNFFVSPKYYGQPLFSFPKWCNEIRELVESGFIRLGVHGLQHHTEEMASKSYQESVSLLKEAESIFHASRLPFVKVFRAPNWSINEDNVKALIDMGYSHLYSHTKFNDLTDRFKDRITVVNYNFNLKHPVPKGPWFVQTKQTMPEKLSIFLNYYMENPISCGRGITVAHGHTSKHPHLNCDNGIWDNNKKVIEFLDLGFEPIGIDEYA